MIETPKLNDPSLVYMYGLSDFWTNIFSDSQLVESVLSSQTIQLGEVYSYFLQRSSGISLEDIQARYKTRLKLVLLNEKDMLEEGTLFKIDPSIVSMNKVTNRPILPTQTLDSGVHFEVSDGTIRFHKHISELRFPVRYTTDGSWEYAVWMSDVEINEQWIDNTFGRIVGFTEDNAIFNYKSFLEGVYYLYSNGPNIAYIERGINLAMGVPYARASESVLGVEQDQSTGNWIVFTQTNSYEIPYGYRPPIAVGDTLVEGDIITSWVEVRDYQRNGYWWHQIYLPNEVLGGEKTSKEVGICKPGSLGDKMMDNFLKHHMFEVIVTQPNGDITSFNTARDLVLYAKPEYTFPIFVWKVPITDEIIDMQEELGYNMHANFTENIIHPPSIRLMDRGAESTPFVRGVSWYNRFQASEHIAGMLGYGEWERNGGWAPEFQGITQSDLNLLGQMFKTRGDLVTPHNRGTVTRGWRGHVTNTDSEGNPLEDSTFGIEWNIPANKVYPYTGVSGNFQERNLVPLYMLTTSELLSKMKVKYPQFKINSGDFKLLVNGVNMQSDYYTWAVRNAEGHTEETDTLYRFGNTIGPLDNVTSIFANRAYIPEVDTLSGSSSLFIFRSMNELWSVNLIKDTISSAPTVIPIADADYINITENYDYDDLGKESTYHDNYLYRGQSSLIAPDTINEVVTELVVIDDYIAPNINYSIKDFNSVISFDEYVKSGHVTWLPYMYDSRTIITDGNSEVNIPEVITDRESLIISYSDSGFRNLIVTDYTIEPGDTEGTKIVLNQPVAVDGIMTVNYIPHEGCPEEIVVSPLPDTVDIQEGYAIRIFADGRLLKGSDYTISGDKLLIHDTSASSATIRYYPELLHSNQSFFNRSTVEKNTARFLMDRSREDGMYEYEDEIYYMNRGGIAWREVPKLDEPPVYASTIDIKRRLQ